MEMCSRMDLRFHNWFLYFCVLTVDLFFVTNGFLVAWNSPVIPKLSSNDTDINPFGQPITTLQLSTLMCLYPLGGMIGTMIIGKIPDIYGRKPTLICLTIMTIISFLFLFVASRIYVYYIFFTILAICAGAGSISIPIYVTEIADDNNRGKMGCIMSLCISSGQFLAYLIGPIVSFQYFALICSTPVFITLIFSYFIPESPVFLATKDDKIGTINTTKQLQPLKLVSDIETDYSEKQRLLPNDNAVQKQRFINIFKSRSGKRAFFISLVLKLLQQSSGAYILLSCLAPLLNEAGSSFSGETLSVVVAAAKILAAFTTVNVVEKLGRRLLVLISSFLCSMSLLSLGLYFYFKNSNFYIPDCMSFIPVVSLVCYMVVFALGLSPIPSIVVTELLPNEYRSMGFSIISILSGTCAIVIPFLFPVGVEYIGLSHCLFIFSLTNFTTFLFTFFMLPETKGKSFSEIRNMLNK